MATISMRYRSEQSNVNLLPDISYQRNQNRSTRAKFVTPNGRLTLNSFASNMDILSVLPVEILYGIIEALLGRPLNGGSGQPDYKFHTLRHLSQTNRFLRQVCQPLMFREVLLRDGSQQKLLKLLLHGEYPARYIEQMTTHNFNFQTTLEEHSEGLRRRQSSPDETPWLWEADEWNAIMKLIESLSLTKEAIDRIGIVRDLCSMVVFLQLLPRLWLLKVDPRSVFIQSTHKYVWDLVFNDDSTIRGPTISWPLGLRDLQEIHFIVLSRSPEDFFDIQELMPYLFAPSLSTLKIDHGKGDCSVLPLEDHTKLLLTDITLHNCCMPIKSVVNLIEACQTLVCFDYRPTKNTNVVQLVAEKIDLTAISNALKTHEKSLEFLSLSRTGLVTQKDLVGCINSLATFTVLRYILIEPTFFMERLPRTQLMDALPRDISCLFIRRPSVYHRDEYRFWSRCFSEFLQVKDYEFPNLRSAKVGRMPYRAWFDIGVPSDICF